MRNTFTRAERLSGITTVEELMRDGESFRRFPFRVIWREVKAQDAPVRILFAVPKRAFKRAVMRNRIRRQLREAFRLNKHQLYAHLDNTGKKIEVMIIYTHREALATPEIQGKIILTLQRLIELTDAGLR